MKQTLALLELLRQRGEAGVTPLEALNQIGCFRLAARVWDLSHDGYDIETHMVELTNGKRIARYVLHERPVQLTLDAAS